MSKQGATFMIVNRFTIIGVLLFPKIKAPVKRYSSTPKSLSKNLFLFFSRVKSKFVGLVDFFHIPNVAYVKNNASFFSISPRTKVQGILERSR